MSLPKPLACPLAALALLAGLGAAVAQAGDPAPPPAAKENPAGTDASGMGQESTKEGDRKLDQKSGQQPSGQPAYPVSPARCDDGRAPVQGACPN